MEILNNVWSTISTPNELLINVLLLPLSFIENTLIMYLFIYALNIKSDKKSKILYITLSSLEGLLSLFFIPSPFNAFINYLFLFTIIHFIFKTNTLRTILSVILPTIIFVLVGTLTINPFVKIIQMDYNTAQLIPIYRFSYMAINYLIFLVIILFVKNKNIYLNILDEFDKKTKLILITCLLLEVFALIVQTFIVANFTDSLPIIISFVSFIALFVFMFMSIYTITRAIKLTLTRKDLKNAEEYNKILQILHDNVRCFKHDYDNTVAAIGGYIKTNDMKGLKKYYSQLEDECVKVNRLYELNPNKINNPGIYSILTTKYYKAEEFGINMNLKVLLDLSTINMSIYEFTKILGILLDNSIDAAKTCNEKIINVLFYNEDKNNRQLLIIENTYKEKDVDLNKIFEKGVTGKENHTGLGLWEIRKILKRNNNLNLHTTKDDTYFKQQFEIYTN